MTTQTTYGECFLISACATIKTLKHECWENDHLFNKDGTLKDHVTDLKEVAKQSTQVANTMPQGMSMRLPQTDGQSKIHIVFGALLLLGGLLLVRRCK